ncbi:UNVERIFIED_CONTAM: hypothetical protein NCL1_44512 [Trichonephila clavipes]
MGLSLDGNEDLPCRGGDVCESCYGSKFSHWCGRLMNAPVMVELEGETDALQIAMKELSYTWDFGNGPYHFQLCASNEDDTRTGTPNFHANVKTLSLNRFNMHQPLYTEKSSMVPQLENASHKLATMTTAAY